MSQARGPLSVLDALRGRRLLVTGATGFIGKVVLAMLLERVPELERVFVLARPRPGREPRERVWDAVRGSPAFESLREKHPEDLEGLLAEKVEVVCGDVTLPGFGLRAEDLERFKGLDAILNVAGLVSLNPGLEDSLAVNADGAVNAAGLAARLGAGLVHMSTCYVAGLRTGVARESQEIAGYSPRGRAFDAPAERDACRRFIQELELTAAARSGVFRREAVERLREKGRPVTDRAVETGAARGARRWIEEQLVREGRARADLWGWPNVYCYTKSMGEQLIARTAGLRYTVVRPSIVESALSYPFPGWNEGLTTSAPVILAMCSGHALWPAHPTAAIDMIPVDLVASSTILATAALVEGRHERVYHQSSSYENPFQVRRCMRFVGEYRKDHYRDHAPDALWAQWLWTRLGVFTVSKETYRAFGVPAFRRAVAALGRGAQRLLGKTPQRLARMERDLAQVEHVVDTFLPFIHDVDCVFESKNLQALAAAMPEHERRLFPWEPAGIDWREYWFEIHTAGLRTWVFPGFPGRHGGPLRPAHRPLVSQAGRAALSALHRFAYARVLRVTLAGAERVPAVGGFIVASNHSSHLDMGLVKFSLGSMGGDMVALAARDYFFRNRWLSFFFRTFTNLLPIGRSGAVKDALAAAVGALRQGKPLLIFPEATRSRGPMRPFKATVGYLAIHGKADVLPVYLAGTARALPKGAVVPRSREISASIGPVLTYAELHARTRHLPRRDAYREATRLIEAAVRALEGGRPSLSERLPS